VSAFSPRSEIARLIAIVTGERVVWRDREAAVERLVEVGEPAVLPLIQAFERDHVGLLMRALGRLGDPRAVEPLLAALSQVNPHVRQDAATALGLIGDPQAIGPLIDAFRVESGDTEDITAWQNAAQALARLGAPAIEPLIAALADEDWNVRTWSADALGLLGSPQAVGPLISALSDAERQVRIDATVALGKIGDASAAEALVARLSDPFEDELVRMYAARALGHVVKGEVFAPSSMRSMIPPSRCAVKRSGPSPRVPAIVRWICCSHGSPIPSHVSAMQQCMRWHRWATRASFPSWSGLKTKIRADAGRAGSERPPATRLSASRNDTASHRHKGGGWDHEIAKRG